MNSNYQDGLNYLTKATFKRAFNALVVLVSYWRSKWSKSSSISGLPISIAIEPTTSCNLRCPECPSGLRNFTRPTGAAEMPVFTKIIDELAPTLTYLILYFQGEPYLNKKFLEMVRYSVSKRIYTATSTNAHYLTSEVAKETVESGLDRLIISIDGTDQATYEAYRIGGQLEKVIEGTKNIIRWKRELKSRTPHVVFQFLVVKPNEHQIDEVYKLADQLGVDEVGVKTAQIYDYENGNDLIPHNEQYSRYKKQRDGSYKIKNKLLDHCWKMWHSCVITWDGKVVPCCFDKDAQHSLGELKDKSFKSVWQSPEYDQFRKMVMSGRDKIEMCKNCTEGTKVWA